MRYSVDVVL